MSMKSSSIKHTLLLYKQIIIMTINTIVRAISLEKNHFTLHCLLFYNSAEACKELWEICACLYDF